MDGMYEPPLQGNIMNCYGPSGSALWINLLPSTDRYIKQETTSLRIMWQMVTRIMLDQTVTRFI